MQISSAFSSDVGPAPTTIGDALAFGSQEGSLIYSDLVILGAGASGLSLALLTQLDYVLVERDERPGGHARSTLVDGWTFDRGPHIMFSRSELLLGCMVGSLGSNVHRCKRNNKVAIAGSLARYPLENDLAALPLPLRSDALISMLEARATKSDPRSLAEWFDATFGEVLVSAYFRPYNEKVWNVPLEELSMSWTERIPTPPVNDVIRGALGEVSEGYTHQLYYSYPRFGGYGALMESWAAGIPPDDIVLGAEVTSVTPTPGGVAVSTTAGEWAAERVVSTLPLHQLLRIVPCVPESVLDAASRLIVNPMAVVTLGFEGNDPNQFTAVYIADPDFLVNRISYPCVFSPENGPPGCFSIQAEVTARKDDEVLGWTDAEIIAAVADGLDERSLIPAGSRRVFERVDRYEHAYVVYTQGYEAELELVAGWLAERGILIHGRFGSHQYLNVDGCLAESIRVARDLGAALSDDAVLSRFAALGGSS